ncbi:MAG: hypothetical protein JSV54_03115, partial [Chloroflexota bacterium]
KVNERTKELQMLNKRLRSMARQMSLAQARERRRIAILLHDSINQNLSSCSMKLELLIRQTPSTEFNGSLNRIYQIIQETIEETRSLTYKLSPPILYEMGLDAALEELTRMFQRDYGLKCIFHTDGEQKPLDKDISILLYQAARELLWNVIKHANANQVVVEAFRFGEEMQLIVSDDGAGLDLDIITGKKRSEGFGFFSIRQLMIDLGGRIEAGPTTIGSRIVLAVPIGQEPATEG